MQSEAALVHPSDAVDEETLQALLIHLGTDKGGAPRPTSNGGEGNGAAPSAETTADTSAVAAQASQKQSHTTNTAAVGTSTTAAFSAATASAAADDIPEYALPDAQYIERTVLPLLLRGLEEVAQARPPDPLAFLGAYLVSNNPQRPSPAAAASSVLVVPANSAEVSAVMEGSQRNAAPQESPFLPSDQPLMAEAVHRAMDRFAPPAKTA